MKMMAIMFQLYLAVKYEVDTYFEDHGYTLPEMWRMATKGPYSDFWRKVCMDDYLANKEQ